MKKSGESELLRFLLHRERTSTELQTQFGWDRPTLETNLASLQDAGIVFHRNNQRICLVREPDQLIPATILARLETEFVGREVVVLRETGSTNDRVRQAALGGEKAGLVIFAEKQTTGRGQHGRRWVSAEGAGLWGSLLLASDPAKESDAILRGAAEATLHSLETLLPVKVSLKLPNDLLIDGAKIGGFLLESVVTPPCRVLGFGVNVRSSPSMPEYPTTFADHYAARPLSRAALAAEILNRFDRWYLRGQL